MTTEELLAIDVDARGRTTGYVVETFVASIVTMEQRADAEIPGQTLTDSTQPPSSSLS